MITIGSVTNRIDTMPLDARKTRRVMSETILGWSGRALVVAVWISALLFGLYIIAFYAGTLAEGRMERWNDVVVGLYDPNKPAATVGLSVHFATGGIILILGCIQLIGSLRDRFPTLHRMLGRIYVICAILAGLGGLASILIKGTVGGTVMDIGFGLYGTLMVLAAVQTYRYARAGRVAEHRAWSIRLFALAIGSWLYRMDYGFWMLMTGGLGHGPAFRGPFDRVMAFFFYVPNLLVAEAFIRGRARATSPVVRLAASAALFAASAFILIGTFYFMKFYWAPAILERIIG